MTEPAGVVITSRSGDPAVLTVTLNRPERGNALDASTTTQLIDLFESLATDPGDVRAVVVRGEGKHFCTGADLSGSGGTRRGGNEQKPATGHMVRMLAHGPHRLISTVWASPLPVIAALKGRTSGLGLHLALACDFTVAAASATIAEPFLERGFNVDSGGSWLLPRFVGLTRAKQLLYTARPISAATAVEWGLVTEVVDDDALEVRAHDLAAELATAATFALGTTKRLLHEHLTDDLDGALRDEAAAIELTIRSDDFKEGMRAFVEKRAPRFEGH